MRTEGETIGLASKKFEEKSKTKPKITQKQRMNSKA
jgi:hypothetical protein